MFGRQLTAWVVGVAQRVAPYSRHLLHDLDTGRQLLDVAVRSMRATASVQATANSENAVRRGGGEAARGGVQHLGYCACMQ